MFKKWLLFLVLLLIMPVQAGDVENAVARGDNVFLYLYSPECKYCVMFSKNYNSLLKAYNGKYSFFKVDSKTKYGQGLMYEFRAAYLPYVVLINGKKKEALHIPPACLLDGVCLEAQMNAFRKG